MVKRTLIIITLALGLAALITLFQVGKFATGDQPQSQATVNEQMNRDQIDLGIMQTEQNLQQLQNLIAGPIPATAVTVTEQQTRITNLQNLFQEQTEQLNLLKEQRANLSALSFQQNNQTRSTASEQTAEVADAQVTTQDQIFNLRDELLRLESANQQAQMSLMPLSQQINRAEQDYQNQLLKLQALQNVNPPANTTNQ